MIPSLMNLVLGQTRMKSAAVDTFNGFYGVFDGLKPSQLLKNKDEMSVSSADGTAVEMDEDEF